MKKLLYIIMIVLASGMTMTACSDDEVKPANGDPRGGAGIQDRI